MAKKKMWFPASSFCVDAGNVSIVDEAYIKENGGVPEAEETCSIKVRPGKYKVKLMAKKSWLGRVQITRTIEVKGRQLIVGDICYPFSDLEQKKWEAFIRRTKCFENLDKRGASLNTGGDGVFPVEVFVERLD